MCQGICGSSSTLKNEDLARPGDLLERGVVVRDERRGPGCGGERHGLEEPLTAVRVQIRCTQRPQRSLSKLLAFVTIQMNAVALGAEESHGLEGPDRCTCSDPFHTASPKVTIQAL